jgi:predicted RNase H-like nuclease
MNGGPLTSRKRTCDGRRERLELLAREGVHIDDGALGRCPAPDDDVLDAAAVAWSAQRIASGRACSFPDPPERDTDGRPVAIWY